MTKILSYVHQLTDIIQAILKLLLLSHSIQWRGNWSVNRSIAGQTDMSTSWPMKWLGLYQTTLNNVTWDVIGVEIKKTSYGGQTKRSGLSVVKNETENNVNWLSERNVCLHHGMERQEEKGH